MVMTARSAGAGANGFNSYTASRPAILGLAKVLFLGLTQVSVASASPIKRFLHIAKDDGKDAEDPSLWLFLGIAAVLVLLGGAFAGLTIALMGQDGIYLQVIATSGEGKEQRHAERVYNLLQKGKHWVLVTLLLSNVIVNETLPIVLDRSLGGGWPAVLGSTALIVIFGEVIPQSVCVRYGMQIGAFMAPFVLGLMWLLAPIAWPTAKLLDYLLGEDHGTTYKKSGLKTLVTLHKTLGPSPSDRLNQDEVTIISAVLDLKDKAVGDIMTPMEDVFTMSADTVLDEKTMDIILSAGYSRIPIYEPGNEGNFVGMLLVKILITYDPEDCKRVSEFALATLPETRPETSCLDIVNFFQEGKSHMVLVSDYPGENFGATGVVTLEDVIEELIGEEIIDESDVYIDVHKAIRRMAPAPKARVQKGHVVANPEIPIPEEHLIDFEEDTDNNEQQEQRHKRHDSIGSEGKGHTPIMMGSSPKTTFLMRRSSGTADGSTNAPIAVRGNAIDMREHLKHLGPSNLASRPKSTRWQTVKIKPGNSTTYPDSPILRHRSDEEPYRDDPSPAHQGGEGSGLLKSAGKEASDGVQALQQGYGSFRSSTPKPTDENHKSVQVNVDGASTPTRDSPPQPFVSRIDSDSSQSDTLRSLPSSRGSPAPRKRNPARSGSITENIIDTGGVRKVVLETNSSGDDPEAGNQDRPASSSKTNLSSVSLGLKNGKSQDERDQSHDAEGEQVKKKAAKRRRKRKNPHKGEEAGPSVTN